MPLKVADTLSLYYKVSLSYLLGLKPKERPNNNIKPMNYNTLLRNLEQLKGLHDQTYESIGKNIGCNGTTCNKYFNGTYLIPLDQLILLSKLYNIDLDTLCGKQDFNISYT